MAAAVYESRPPLKRTTARRLDATCRGIPDVLVQLELDTHGQMVRENPLRQESRIHDAVHGRYVDGPRPPYQIVARDHFARVYVVLTVLDDELHLVMGAKAFEIAPVIVGGFTASGT